MAYDIETFIWTAALLAAGMVVIWFGRAMRRGLRHGGNLGALPHELAGNGHLRDASFSKRWGDVSRELADKAQHLSDEERDIVNHALWHAMLLEAGADGSVDARELRFIAEFFGRLSGRKLATDGAMESAEFIAAHPHQALGEVAKARGASDPARRQILESAMLVSLADGALIDSEANRLGDIADALGITLDERKQVYEGMTDRFGR